VHTLDEDGRTVEVTAVRPDAAGLRRLAAHVLHSGHEVDGTIKSMTGARFFHDTRRARATEGRCGRLGRREVGILLRRQRFAGREVGGSSGIAPSCLTQAQQCVSCGNSSPGTALTRPGVSAKGADASRGHGPPVARCASHPANGAERPVRSRRPRREARFQPGPKAMVRFRKRADPPGETTQVSGRVERRGYRSWLKAVAPAWSPSGLPARWQ
jgi:hypothetical protein